MSVIQKMGNYPVPPGVIEGPAAWCGPRLDASREWVWHFSEDELVELDAAMVAVKAKGIDIVDIQKTDFPLPALGPKLDEIRQELLVGRGFVLFRGLPVARYTIEETAILY